MTELQLYKFLQDNAIEYHFWHNDIEVENLEEYSEENSREWEIMIYPQLRDLQGFTDICDESLFDDGRIEIYLAKQYVAIDLLPIMEYYGIEPKNIFQALK